jgi:hypothetical protein
MRAGEHALLFLHLSMPELRRLVSAPRGTEALLSRRIPHRLPGGVINEVLTIFRHGPAHVAQRP